MKISDIYTIFSETCSGTVSTDTRKIIPGSLFVALRGDTWNGNEFVHEALQSGCRAALVDDLILASEPNCYYVEDVEKTLQQLALYHRKQYAIPIIAITGSNGKTTTKELIARVLETEKKVIATEGNYNNHLGVPLTLLRITNETEIAIIEMGANHVGEIAFLCEIAHPTHGLITNIGRAHIGLFGGYENIIKGKTELYEYLRKNNKEVFVCSNDILLMEKSEGIRRVTFGLDAPGEYRMISKCSSPHLELIHNSQEIKTQLIGEYNLGNVEVALALGVYFGINQTFMYQAVETYVPSNLRSEIFKSNTGNIIIKDYYNANPSSVELAIRNAENLSGGKDLILILGDMFELGEYSQDEHTKILDQAIATSAESIYLVGADFSMAVVGFEKKQINEHQKRMFSFKTTDEAVFALREQSFINKTILLKGSRGMKFEKIFDVIHSF